MKKLHDGDFFDIVAYLELLDTKLRLVNCGRFPILKGILSLWETMLLACKKPCWISSFDVVKIIRTHFQERQCLEILTLKWRKKIFLLLKINRYLL